MSKDSYELQLGYDWMYNRFLEIGAVYGNWFTLEDGAPYPEDGYEFIPEYFMDDIVELMQHECREKLFFDLLVANFFLCQHMHGVKKEDQMNVFDYLGMETFSKAIGLSDDESNLIADLSGFDDAVKKYHETHEEKRTSEQQEREQWIREKEMKIEERLRKLGVTDEEEIERQKTYAEHLYDTRENMEQEEVAAELRRNKTVKVDMTHILSEGYVSSHASKDFLQYVKGMNGEFSMDLLARVRLCGLNIEVEVDDERLPDGVTPEMVGDSVGLLYADCFHRFIGMFDAGVEEGMRSMEMSQEEITEEIKNE